MTFQAQINALATRVAQEINALRSEMGGSGGVSVYDYAKRSSTSTSTINPRLIIPWQTVLKAGTDITWDAANNTRFTIGATGVYRIGAFLTYQSSTQRAQANGEIFINGVSEGVFRGDTYVRNSGSTWDYGIAEISPEPFDLSAGDYVEIAIARTSGAGTNYTTGGQGTLNFRGQYSRAWVERTA
ncbi:MAG: hypothetical protein AAGH90_13330 [Pseudomonadota bacterium]